MPVAIGISGVLILVINALPAALVATIVVTILVCGVWTWVAVLLYRAYAPALVAALDRRRHLDPDAAFEATDDQVATARDLLASRRRARRAARGRARGVDVDAGARRRPGRAESAIPTRRSGCRGSPASRQPGTSRPGISWQSRSGARQGRPTLRSG